MKEELWINTGESCTLYTSAGPVRIELIEIRSCTTARLGCTAPNRVDIDREEVRQEKLMRGLL